MKRILTGAAALRREDRLQQREDRLSDRVLDLRAQIATLTEENERLRGILRRVTPDPVWGEDPRTKSYYLEARAALQPKEDK